MGLDFIVRKAIWNFDQCDTMLMASATLDLIAILQFHESLRVHLELLDLYEVLRALILERQFEPCTVAIQFKRHVIPPQQPFGA
jgi:hypothetical protein